VEGGISIIGTTGIVSPFSHEAFVESIRREISVAKSSGSRLIVLNSGARSEKAVQSYYPSLPSYCFIHYGNAIDETLEAAEKAGIEEIAMGVMIGKAVKLAEGHLNTHSHNVSMNKDFLMEIGRQAGLGACLIDKISEINLARQLWEIIPQETYPGFYDLITNLCHSQARRIFSGKLTIHLVRD
ncbi:MAG: cobalt-precorrin-5B (C(1))-methyltransferase, partial [Muribaculaceae bacterium]|nr:cobalt-precorrin-5B (C(1))-methyltransferase [Muribaculaceae bacterium]